MSDEKSTTSHLQSAAPTDGYSSEKDRTNLSRVDSEIAKYASDARVNITPDENKRLKRMVDKRVLSIMVFTYFLQALDKGTLSFASIMGIREDTNLVGQQVDELPRILLAIFCLPGESANGGPNPRSTNG